MVGFAFCPAVAGRARHSLGRLSVRDSRDEFELADVVAGRIGYEAIEVSITLFDSAGDIAQDARYFGSKVAFEGGGGGVELGGEDGHGLGPFAADRADLGIGLRSFIVAYCADLRNGSDSDRHDVAGALGGCLLYTSPSPRD